MNPPRTLALKREALRRLTDDELHGVAGGDATLLSCLDYVSCHILQCLLEPGRAQG